MNTGRDVLLFQPFSTTFLRQLEPSSRKTSPEKSISVNMITQCIMSGVDLFPLLPVSYTHLTLPTTPYV